VGYGGKRLTSIGAQIWGFEEVEGKRYYVRHVAVRKGADWKQARLVYDYQVESSGDDGLAY